MIYKNCEIWIKIDKDIAKINVNVLAMKIMPKIAINILQGSMVTENELGGLVICHLFAFCL